MKFKLPVGEEHCLYFTKEELECLLTIIHNSDCSGRISNGLMSILGLTGILCDEINSYAKIMNINREV